MQNNPTTPAPNLSTVKDNLPLPLIWHKVAKEAISSINIVSVIVFVFIFFLVLLVGFDILTSNESAGPFYILFTLIFIVGIIGSFIWRVAKKTRVQLRAEALAQANGFTFIKGLKNPFYPGLIFSIGDTKQAYPIVRGIYSQRQFTIMNYSYMEGGGKNRREYNKGVIMIKLPRKLPNVIFDSKSNNFLGMSNLDATFSRSQRFNLEGDFNKHFDVYAPQNYGLDVLYFMTPELMALLIDEAGNYDIEVVDDSLFFYAPEFDFKTGQLQSIFKIIQNIGGEFTDNTQRYADERVGSKDLNIVSEPGRRLKKSISWVTVAAIAVYAAFQILSVIRS